MVPTALPQEFFENIKPCPGKVEWIVGTEMGLQWASDMQDFPDCGVKGKCAHIESSKGRWDPSLRDVTPRPWLASLLPRRCGREAS